MRYFRAKVYFKSWRAPGNLLLPNQFQKWSNSVPLIGQKNIFLANQRGVLAAVFFIDRLSYLVAWPVQRGDCCGKFPKKVFSEAEETTRLNMGLVTNIRCHQFSRRIYRRYIVIFFITHNTRILLHKAHLYKSIRFFFTCEKSLYSQSELRTAISHVEV